MKTDEPKGGCNITFCHLYVPTRQQRGESHQQPRNRFHGRGPNRIVLLDIEANINPPHVRDHAAVRAYGAVGIFFSAVVVGVASIGESSPTVAVEQTKTRWRMMSFQSSDAIKRVWPGDVKL